MQKKLQELTEKIYLDGISKGKKEAEQIVSEARSESDKIKEEAEKEARAIVENAEKEAQEIMKNSLSELKISFRHAVNSLKQDVEKAITCKVAEDPVSDVFSGNDFVARLIETVAGNWSPEDIEAGIDVNVPEEMADDIEKYFTAGTNDALARGIKLHPVKSMEKGFEIRPHGKEYKISVTESDFVSYIKEFLRPRLVDLLFEKE
jgi:V/A-type H+/Na+-transporting ATPase subunit E